MSLSTKITFSHVAKIFKSAIIEKPKPVPWGRWSLDNKKYAHLIVDYSNEDHCGTCAQYLNTKVDIKNIQQIEKKKDLYNEKYLEYDYANLVLNNPN